MTLGMVKKIFWVIFGIAAFGAISRGLPDGEGDTPGGADRLASAESNPWSVDAPAVSSSNKVSMQKGGSTGWSGGDVTLRRQSDGHFYANITVDSQDMRVLVDTGASIIALTGHDARMLGLDWNPADVRPIGRGASGDVYGVPVMLDSVSLEGIEASKVQAVIVPDGLDVTLLGQSFLSQIDKVEISGNKMVLVD